MGSLVRKIYVMCTYFAIESCICVIRLSELPCPQSFSEIELLPTVSARLSCSYRKTKDLIPTGRRIEPLHDQTTCWETVNSGLDISKEHAYIT
jgi:hypothetical protein